MFGVTPNDLPKFWRKALLLANVVLTSIHSTRIQNRGDKC